ncbi:Metallo-dependent phosphatase-like protein [Aspergillus bertholletiae]|uniref:Metallo-dependent phosphatase-like protein n=1 Tax=Aspergillus bertholletiae TaxID=1226010 RepID=A0A5N7B3X2_9EURO|nr:Metallo-dependent phosphatase-like protein [Aspergillus bertholletiae]
MDRRLCRTVKTRFLVISDTHSRAAIPSCNGPADVVIHCRDLAMGSTLDEFNAAINLLEQIDAPLKLVIAGNHDFTLDPATFQNKIREAQRLQDIDPLLIEKTYGYIGQVRELFNHVNVKGKHGIRLLDEGTHCLTLQNGASLTLYASPYTPSFGGWGFQYDPHEGHEFAIGTVDLVMTHGPPRGVLDMPVSGPRAGCEHLFERVARSKPRMHCFGHIHASWGAKLVTWRKTISKTPSHLTGIDNGQSAVIGKLSNAKASGPQPSYLTSHCSDDAIPLRYGSQTLFVNAAIEGSNDFPSHPAWIVDLDLQAAF